MLEFAFTFPLLLLVLVMFIELGRVVYYYTALSNAVREGARFAIVHQFASAGDRLSQIEQRVSTYAVWISLESGDVSVYCDKDEGDVEIPCEDYVTVTASIQVPAMTPIVARFLGGDTGYNISAESTMLMTPWGSQ